MRMADAHARNFRGGFFGGDPRNDPERYDEFGGDGPPAAARQAFWTAATRRQAEAMDCLRTRRLAAGLPWSKA